MDKIISFIIGYITGSFPSAYILGKIFKKIDIRKLGDGRIGMSFSIKEMGKRIGISVGMLDFLKGFLTLLILTGIGFSKGCLIFTGIGSIIGHDWSLFIGFKGGLGAMTTYGVLFYFYPVELVVFIILGLIFYSIVKNTYYTTFFITAGISFTSIFTKKDFFMFLLPLLLLAIMTLKIRKTREINA